MSRIYTAYFDNLPLRIVCFGKQRALYVSKSDFVAIANRLDNDLLPGKQIMNTGLSEFIDADERRSMPIADNEIGLCCLGYAVGGLILTVAEFRTHEKEEVRELGYRYQSLLNWYSYTMTEAGKYFNLSIEDMMHTVVTKMNKTNPPFIVEVIKDEESKYWVASCEDLGLVTEAQTYEELTERCWEVVPDLIELNGLQVNPKDVRLRFENIENAQKHLMVN